MKKENSLEAQLQEQTNFIDSLAKKYPNLVWEKDSKLISDCPVGWRQIVDDLFAELSILAHDGVGYIKVGYVKRFTDACNRGLDKLRVPHKFRFRRRFSYGRIVRPSIRIDQIKEKFAELRVYYSCDDPKTDDRIKGLVSLAERICRRTCQISGKPGKLRADFWYIVLSDVEYQKIKRKKK